MSDTDESDDPVTATKKKTPTRLKQTKSPHTTEPTPSKASTMKKKPKKVVQEESEAEESGVEEDEEDGGANGAGSDDDEDDDDSSEEEENDDEEGTGDGGHGYEEMGEEELAGMDALLDQDIYDLRDAISRIPVKSSKSYSKAVEQIGDNDDEEQNGVSFYPHNAFYLPSLQPTTPSPPNRTSRSSTVPNPTISVAAAYNSQGPPSPANATTTPASKKRKAGAAIKAKAKSGPAKVTPAKSAPAEAPAKAGGAQSTRRSSKVRYFHPQNTTLN
jgi:hypothetical protein